MPTNSLSPQKGKRATDAPAKVYRTLELAFAAVQPISTVSTLTEALWRLPMFASEKQVKAILEDETVLLYVLDDGDTLDERVTFDCFCRIVAALAATDSENPNSSRLSGRRKSPGRQAQGPSKTNRHAFVTNSLISALAEHQEQMEEKRKVEEMLSGSLSESMLRRASTATTGSDSPDAQRRTAFDWTTVRDLLVEYGMSPEALKHGSSSYSFVPGRSPTGASLESPPISPSNGPTLQHFRKLSGDPFRQGQCTGQDVVELLRDGDSSICSSLPELDDELFTNEMYAHKSPTEKQLIERRRSLRRSRSGMDLLSSLRAMEVRSGPAKPQVLQPEDADGEANARYFKTANARCLDRGAFGRAYLAEKPPTKEQWRAHLKQFVQAEIDKNTKMAAEKLERKRAELKAQGKSTTLVESHNALPALPPLTSPDDRIRLQKAVAEGDPLSRSQELTLAKSERKRLWVTGGPQRQKSELVVEPESLVQNLFFKAKRAALVGIPRDQVIADRQRHANNQRILDSRPGHRKM